MFIWEWKSGRLTEVAVLQMAVLWGNFIKESLGSWQGNEFVAVLKRWPSYRVAVLRGSTVRPPTAPNDRQVETSRMDTIFKWFINLI